MGKYAIRVNGISKKYQIGAQKARYSTFRDVLSNALSAPFRRAAMVLRGQAYGAAALTETLWALRDISFDVERGEVVGIIGANGAGKSTLLKILSRITEPTEGEARVYGRVGALLEVGTGFHPELTGRENIYLNAAILGMTRHEIKSKFDEIVAFAEVEKFVDTPVKYYSSGMGLRLGFAVAAHLEPEILIVDEVLAVGDVQFQKKCLGKMTAVASEGRTVLFVSHNMAAIKALCSRGVLLRQGFKVLDGPVDQVVAQYLEAGAQSVNELTWPDEHTAPGGRSGKAYLRAVRILDRHGRSTNQVNIQDPVYIEAEYEVVKPNTVLNVSLSLYAQGDEYVLASPSATDGQWYMQPHPAGLYRSRCEIPGNLLNEGRYRVTVILVENGMRQLALVEKGINFDVVDVARAETKYFGRWYGVVRPTLQWVTQQGSPNPAEVAAWEQGG